MAGAAPRRRRGGGGRRALISGAGIAGPATAWWLNAAGWQTTIVESAPAPRTGGYVIDFWGLGYDLAERMGLSEGIERSGYHMRELRVAGDDGRRLAGFGTRVFDELTGGRYVTLPRSDLSRLLLQAVAPETDLVYGEEIVEIGAAGRGGLRARLAGGEVVPCDLVIGADGLHSGVRRLAFGPQARFEKPLGYAVAAFETTGYRPRDPDVYVLYGKPGRMVGRFTLRDDRCLFLFVFELEGAPPAAPEARKALLHDLYGYDGWETQEILRRLDDADDVYLDRVSQIVAPSWSAGRTVLVGDAAHCVSLLAGQGAALAIVGAYVLAGELSRPQRRIENGLAAYERFLRRYVASKHAAAVRFAGAFAPRTAFGVWFRNLVIRLLAIPGIARIALGRDIFDRLALPDYPLLTLG